MSQPAATGDFSMSQARGLIGDLLKPKPWVYWTDLLVSYAIGAVCFTLVRVFVDQHGLLSWQVALTFLVQCLLFYRIATFIHELVHLPKEGFTGFRVVWNLLVGIPFLMPSFVYHTHVHHHRRKHYGTQEDGEYLPLGHRHPILIVGYLLQTFLIAPAAVFRWLVLTPLTWLHPWIRNQVHEKASSMVINPGYLRPLPDKKALRLIRLQELGVFLWCAGVAGAAFIPADWWRAAGVAYEVRSGWLAPPIPFLIHAYASSVVILMLNSLRTVVSHRWANNWGRDEAEMTFTEQLLDSVNFPRRPWLTGLWGPIGMRFHALHHLFPSMPYHSMAAAHHRLMAGLPADSPYRQTVEGSMFSALSKLWRRAAESTRKAKSITSAPHEAAKATVAER